MKQLRLVLFIGLMCSLLCKTQAVVAQQETAVNVCKDIEILTGEKAYKASLLKDYKGFQQATLFVDADSVYILEILYKPENFILKNRKIVTLKEVEQLCEEINQVEYVSSLPITPKLDQSGRRELITSSMVYSLGYYGWAIPSALNIESERGYLASYMLIGGAGFFVPFLSTRNKEVTEGMARGYAVGGTLGLMHGLGISTLLQDFNNDPKVDLGITVATSIGESLAGYAIAKKYNLNKPHMRMIGSGGSWGLLYGLAVPLIVESGEARVYAFGSLLGSGVGMAGGNYFAKRQEISDGDVSVINSLGVVGTYLPFAVVNSLSSDLDPEIGRVYIASAVGGSLIGLGAGLNRTKNYNYTNQQGNIISLGTLSGGLAGLGFAYIVSDPNSQDPSSIYLWSSGLGALGGFFLTDWLVRSEFGGKRSKTGMLKIDVNPSSLASNFRKSNQQPVDLMNYNYRVSQNYLIKARIQF